jgi:hypothetical protein
MSYLQSLWNLLNFRKAMLLTEHGQDPFDQLHANFKEPIVDDDISKASSRIDDSTTSEELNILLQSDLQPHINKTSEFDSMLMRKICHNKMMLIEPMVVFNALNLLYRLIQFRLIPKGDDEGIKSVIFLNLKCL